MDHELFFWQTIPPLLGSPDAQSDGPRGLAQTDSAHPRPRGLTQTDSERSLLPTAQQQYGQLGFAELPFFCFFLKILGLNF